MIDLLLLLLLFFVCTRAEFWFADFSTAVDLFAVDANEDGYPGTFALTFLFGFGVFFECACAISSLLNKSSFIGRFCFVFVDWSCRGGSELSLERDFRFALVFEKKKKKKKKKMLIFECVCGD